MMRRGPLNRYDAEWILRQAAESEASGSIEFHTDRPVTLYLRNGRVCHGAEGVAEPGLVAEVEAQPTDESLARQEVVALVTTALAAKDGWYYLDPIGHHAVDTEWDWDGASLILEARSRTQPAGEHGAVASVGPALPADLNQAEAAPQPAASGSTDPALAPVVGPERCVELVVPADDGPITLTAEAWRIACALATARDAAALRDDLGWTGPRLDAALGELAAAGVVSVPAPAQASPTIPGPAPATARPSIDEIAPPPEAAPVSTESGGQDRVTPPAPPTAPPLPGSQPSPTVDRRRALRRRSTTKPA